MDGFEHVDRHVQILPLGPFGTPWPKRSYSTGLSVSGFTTDKLRFGKWDHFGHFDGQVWLRWWDSFEYLNRLHRIRPFISFWTLDRQPHIRLLGQFLRPSPASFDSAKWNVFAPFHYRVPLWTIVQFLTHSPTLCFGQIDFFRRLDSEPPIQVVWLFRTFSPTTSDSLIQTVSTQL